MTSTLIAVELTTKPAANGKAWIAEITGTDEQYGLAREFVPVKRVGKSHSAIVGAGVYECSDGDFAVVLGDGTVLWRDRDLAVSLVGHDFRTVGHYSAAVVAGEVDDRTPDFVATALASVFGPRFRGLVPVAELVGPRPTTPKAANTIDDRWIDKAVIAAYGLAAALKSAGIGDVTARDEALAQIRALMAKHGITPDELA